MVTIAHPGKQGAFRDAREVDYFVTRKASIPSACTVPPYTRTRIM
jgi:hypothetical protein